VIQRPNIAVDIADALSYLHANSVSSIIHCNMKPSNVLLGEDMTVLIGDFGLAPLPSCSLSQGATTLAAP
jgi:serine/threonine protein kinase